MDTASSSHSSPRLPEAPPRGPAPPEDGNEAEDDEPTRNWRDLPLDALLVVLSKLDQVDILMGAELACRSWRRASRDEPVLWRRIDLRHRGRRSPPAARRRTMVLAAVRRSAGRCEAFWCEDAEEDGVVSLLGESSLSLKSLRLISFARISDTRLKLCITKFNLLEELELSNCTAIFPGTCEAVGNACPLLKRFRLSSGRFDCSKENNINDEAMGIATMRGLRSLQLFAQHINDDGLAAILDGCTDLESLDIRHCYNVVMYGDLLDKCSKMKTLRLPNDSTGDYDLKFSSPYMDMDSPWVIDCDHYWDDSSWMENESYGKIEDW